MASEGFLAQVRLLMRVLPLLGAQEALALKGGTAINPFVQNLPRLSVDIDLAYTGLEDRDEALTGIHTELARTQTALEALEQARAELLDRLHAGFTSDNHAFLLSVAEGRSRWDLLPSGRISDLPAVRWKLHNIGLMTPAKRGRPFGHSDLPWNLGESKTIDLGRSRSKGCPICAKCFEARSCGTSAPLQFMVKLEARCLAFVRKGIN